MSITPRIRYRARPRSLPAPAVATVIDGAARPDTAADGTPVEKVAEADTAAVHGAMPVAPAPTLEPASEVIDPKPSYAVGYGRPPVDTRFGGPRGNRSGRKKGSKSRRTIIEEELNAKVDVPGYGKLSKFQLTVRQLANHAAKGDLKAVAAVLRLGFDLDRAADTAVTPPDTSLDEDERSIVAMLMEMAREAVATPPASTDKGERHD